MSLANFFTCVGRNLFHRQAVEKELDEEVRAYVAMLRDEKIQAGMPPAEAYRQALIEFGGVEYVKVEYVKEEARDVRIGGLITSLFEDMRHGVRTLVRNPGFAVAALLSLALGIGATVALFSLVNGILVQPLPYSEPERLVRVKGFYPKGAVLAIRELSKTMDVASFTVDSEVNVTGHGQALHVAGSSVSSNLFRVLGIRTAAGELGDAPDSARAERPVIISYKLWQHKFGGAPDVLGSEITVDGLIRKVVGITWKDFQFPNSSTQLWIPQQLNPQNWEDYWAVDFTPIIARLKPGVTLNQAQGELRPLISRVITMFPYPMAREWNANAAVVPLRDEAVSGVRRKLRVLACAVGMVFLIACANVTSLLLSRSAARRGEIALRASLGAAPARLVRQLLTESAVLATAGGTLGLALASAAIAALKSALPVDTPRLSEIGIDWWTVLFLTVVALVTAFLFGLAPALSLPRSDMAALVKPGGRHPSGRRGMHLRNVIVAGQVALSFSLALSAGLLIKSLWLITRVDPGFQAEHILTVRMFPNPSACLARAACIGFYDELLRKVRAISGVSGVAAENAVPLSGAYSSIPVEVEDHPLRPEERLAPLFWAAAVTPEYFRIMRIPILEGRPVNPSDGAESPGVVLVSASTARRFWPGGRAVGKHIRPVWDTEWRTVVGVVQDVRVSDLTLDLPPDIAGAIYMPYPQAVSNSRRIPAAMTLLIRATAEPQQVATNVRRIVAEADPTVRVGEARTLESVVAASTSQSRSMMWLFVSFGASALVMAAIGIYGIVSYSASQRTYELGVRAAFGATKLHLLRLVLRQSLTLAATGLVLGAAASLLLTRMLSGFLYGVATTDPGTYLAVAVLLFVAALAAGYLAARRAAEVDPVTALRTE